jgi:hypothetical protein
MALRIPHLHYSLGLPLGLIGRAVAFGAAVRRQPRSLKRSVRLLWELAAGCSLPLTHPTPTTGNYPPFDGPLPTRAAFLTSSYPRLIILGLSEAILLLFFCLWLPRPSPSIHLPTPPFYSMPLSLIRNPSCLSFCLSLPLTTPPPIRSLSSAL